MTLAIDISIHENSWDQASANFVEDAVRAVLAAPSLRGVLATKQSSTAMEALDCFADARNDAIEVSVLLTNDAEIQDLNKTYRHKDKPTNVLSFPQNEPGLLGDVILALETIQKESKEQEKPFANHLRHLVIHGTLHLLGFDHETDEEAEVMEGLERDICAALNIPDPYKNSNDSIKKIDV